MTLLKDYHWISERTYILRRTLNEWNTLYINCVNRSSVNMFFLRQIHVYCGDNNEDHMVSAS